MRKLFIATLFLMAFPSIANEVDVLTVDRVVSKDLELAFPNDKNVQATSSDFALENYVIMSNELGERWAVLTLTNTSTGNRTLQQAHLIALFADGQRKAPHELKLNFEGRETQSITVSFGESKFPILSVSTRMEK